MSAYSPPTEKLPVFNSLVFGSSLTSSDITFSFLNSYLSSNYLMYPTAQNATEYMNGISNTGNITNTGTITNAKTINFSYSTLDSVTFTSTSIGYYLSTSAPASVSQGGTIASLSVPVGVWLVEFSFAYTCSSGGYYYDTQNAYLLYGTSNPIGSSNRRYNYASYTIRVAGNFGDRLISYTYYNPSSSGDTLTNGIGSLLATRIA